MRNKSASTLHRRHVCLRRRRIYAVTYSQVIRFQRRNSLYICNVLYVLMCFRSFASTFYFALLYYYYAIIHWSLTLRAFYSIYGNMRLLAKYIPGSVEWECIGGIRHFSSPANSSHPCWCLYCVVVFHFTISMYLLRTLHPVLHQVTLYLYACWCHGLRLPDLNKETTYLLTYIFIFVHQVIW